jgi:chitin disaccharide deacetylase
MQKPNPYLKRLGFSDDDRVVVLHADDIGMCQSTVAAYADLIECGSVSSVAMMVPCPWFPAAVGLYHEHPASLRLDVGAHLTLTSEWNPFRWRPLAITDPGTGLLDGEGYFHRLAAPVQADADPPAVARELEAQIETALAAGLDLTHMDSHMLTIFHPKFLPIYFDLARTYGLPAFMLRGERDFWLREGLSEAEADELLAVTERVEAEGLPLFDRLHVMSLTEHTGRLEAGVQALAACPPGLTHFVIHPAADSPELRAMAPDWRCRVADLALFTSQAWTDAVASSGVKVIGYREIRDVMRAGL